MANLPTMSRFESNIKQIPYAQQSVYDRLSDPSNMEHLRQHLPDDKAESLSFTDDSITVAVPPMGSITLRIVEREEPKTIKMAAEQSPMPFNLWIQLLPTGDDSSKMKLTLDADINPFLKAVVSKPLQEGLERMADTLAALKYE